MTTQPTTNLTYKAEALAVAVVQAERIAEQASANLKAAKAAFVEAARAAGLHTVEVDEAKVTWTEKVRRLWDTEVLARLVPHATFTKVTKVAVNTKAFDAARELGEIDAAVEAAATTKATPYTEVRVTKG